MLLARAVIGSVWSLLTSTIIAQELVDNADERQNVSAASNAALSAAPANVDVNPLAHDDEIGQRLQGVLDATGWFLGCGACCRTKLVDVFEEDLLREPRLGEQMRPFREPGLDGEIGYLNCLSDGACAFLDGECAKIRSVK